jgi:cobalt-zinc-cadmium efflux system membrane fusion protein
MTRKNLIFVLALFIAFAGFGCGGKSEPQAEKKTEATHEGEKEGGEKHEDEKKGGQKHAEEKGRVKLSPEGLKNAGIKTAAAKAEAITDTLAVTATISHNQDRLFHVTPRITGRVVDVRVSVGSEVKTGSVLAVLDSIELGQTKSEYIKTQTLLDLAKANYEREKSLFDQKIAAKKDVLSAEAEYRKTEAEARSLHERLRLYGLSDQAITNLNNVPSQYILISPAAGVVLERDMSKGEVIEAGKKVATISDLSTVWVLLNIHEKDLAKVKQGTTVKIHTESYRGEVFAGKVAYIGNVVEPQTRTVPLRVEVPNPRARLKPGMFATAEVVTGISSTEAIMIPSSAIQKIEGKPAVFVQGKDGSFAKRELELGREFGNSVEVNAGLKEGEQVVVTGAFTLKSELLKEGLEGHGH